jgi:nitrogenase molybdenum-iron protein alpha/beta subunit
MCAQVYIMVQVSVRVGSHKYVKRVGVDLLMVNSRGKYIVDDDGLVFTRVGFPVYDRVGYRRRAIIWHGDGINLVDRITNAILERGTRSKVQVLFGMGDGLILAVLL